MKNSLVLRRNLINTMIALLIALGVMTSATFAWYIYNTSAHTTKLHMAAGSTASLQISNAYEGPYGSSTVLASFTGVLTPVSTNNIEKGFQKVTSFTSKTVTGSSIATGTSVTSGSGVGTGSSTGMFAYLFKGANDAYDYYKTSVYIKSPGDTKDICISNIGFEDSSDILPISTAIRIGFVVHSQGQNQPVANEYIFAISSESNPEKEYNTYNGQEGDVLNSDFTDGTTITFTPYTKNNFCNYDSATGVASKTTDSLVIGTLSGASNEPIQVDIYIWLEGCDEDCTNSLQGQTLRNVALSFAGI